MTAKKRKRREEELEIVIKLTACVIADQGHVSVVIDGDLYDDFDAPDRGRNFEQVAAAIRIHGRDSAEHLPEAWSG